MTSLVYHITTQAGWSHQQESQNFSTPSLETEGFIHCAYRDQVLGVANRRFVSQQNLVLLVIDESRLSAEVVVEDTSNSGEKHPHVYGPIEKESIIQIVDFVPVNDGLFELPVNLV